MSALLAALMLLPSSALAPHELAKDPPRCDRLSVCLIVDCDDDAICLLPGLPLPDLPGLG